MPKPSSKHSRLDPLIGEWAGHETLHPAPWDPAGGIAAARVVNRRILDGFGLVQEYEQERDGVVTFKGHGVFWYDEQAQEHVMTWWDSMGGSGTHYRGQFQGERLVLGAPMPQGGRSRAIFDVGSPGRYHFLMEVSMDGVVWSPAMEGSYTRTAAAKPAAQKAVKRRKAHRKATARTGRKPARQAVPKHQPVRRKASARKKAASKSTRATARRR